MLSGVISRKDYEFAGGFAGMGIDVGCIPGTKAQMVTKVLCAY
jgi:hypothetical protein